MSEGRDLRKMIEKTTWYEDRDLKQEPDQPGRVLRRNPNGVKRNHHLTPQQRLHQPAAVLFTPRTPSGKLLIQLRQAEARLQQICPSRYKRLKIVESGGVKLKKILLRDPWEGIPCDRPQCTACTGTDSRPGTCSVRGIVYHNLCKLCEEAGNKTRYIGESGRTIWERSAPKGCPEPGSAEPHKSPCQRETARIP